MIVSNYYICDVCKLNVLGLSENQYRVYSRTTGQQMKKIFAWYRGTPSITICMKCTPMAVDANAKAEVISSLEKL